jgi:hypothetical protein
MHARQDVALLSWPACWNIRTCVCVCIPSSIVIIRALISIIITPHKSARISEEALTGLENLLCARAQSISAISAASFACAYAIFSWNQLRRFPKYGAGIALSPASDSEQHKVPLLQFYIRRAVCAVFPFNHWLLRKDKCKCCVSSAFSAGVEVFFF